MGWALDQLEDAADFVAEDVIGNAIDWVVDEVIDPVMTTVGNVIDAALSNPVKTIAQIAAVTIPGMQWTLPLIEAADVVAKGGDLQDALEAAAIAYVTQKVSTTVGNYAGNEVLGTVSEAGPPTATQVAMSNVVRGGVTQATAAVLTGKDPVKAFITGGLPAATSAALGQIDGYTELQKTSPAAANAIAAYVGTEIAGGDGTKAAIGAAIATGSFVKDTINAAAKQGVFSSDKATADMQKSLAADMLTRTSTAILTGGNVSAAVTSSLMKAGIKSIENLVKDATTQQKIKDVKASYDNAQTAGNALTKNETDQQSIATAYNRVQGEMADAVNKQNTLKKDYDTKLSTFNANKTQANLDAVNAAATTYNNYVSQLKLDIEDYYKPTLQDYVDQMDDLQSNYTDLMSQYENRQDTLILDSDQLTTSLDLSYAASDAAFVKAIDPNFNAAEYVKINSVPAGQSAYEHYLSEGINEGVYTNFAAAEADILASRQNLAVQVAKAGGQDYYTLSDADRQRLDDRVTSLYGNNIERLRSATVQDVLEGRVENIWNRVNDDTTADKLMSDASSGFNVEVRGIGILAETADRLPAGYELPAGLRLVSMAEIDANTELSAQYVNGQLVFVTKDDSTMPTSFNRDAGEMVPVVPEVLKNAKTMDELVTDDPEAALFMMSQFEQDAQGDMGDYLTNTANAFMLAAYATGNKEFGDTVKQTLSLTTQAVGEQLSSLATFYASVTGTGYDNALIKAGNDLKNWGAANQSADTVQQEQNIIDAAKNAKGFFGTIGAVSSAIVNNFGGFTTLIAKEGIQELLPLGAAKWVGRFGKIAAHSVNAAVEFAESYGGNAQETYNALIKQGKSVAEAERIADIVGLQAGAVTLFTSGIGDAPVVNRVLGDMVQDTAARFVGSVAREGVTEFFDEALGNAAQQYQTTGKVNWSNAWTAGAVASAIGAGTTGSILGAYTINDAAQVGVDATGKPVSLSQFLSGERVPTSVDLNASVGTDNSGNYISLADIGAAAKSDPDFTPVFTEAFATVPTVYTAIDDAASMSADEARTFLESQGYTNPTSDEIALFTGTSEAQSRAAADAWADPRVTTLDEARQMMTDLGYKNVTDAEALSLAGKITEAAAQKKVATYVDQHTVTEAEVRAAFAKEGYIPTPQQVAEFVQSGATVNQASVLTAINKKYDPQAVSEEEVRAAYANLGIALPAQVDIDALVGIYPEVELAARAEGNLDTARFNSIMARLDAISGVDTTGANALGTPASVDENGNVTPGTGVYAAIDATAADIQQAIAAKMATYESDGIKRDTALQTAIGQVSADLGVPLAAVRAQLGTPTSVDEDGNPVAATGVYAIIDASTNSVLEKMAEYEATGLSRDKALDKAITAVSTDLGIAKAELAEQIGAPASVDEDGNPVEATGVFSEIEAAKQSVLAKMAEYEVAGVDRAKALNQAIDAVASDLGIAKSELTNKIGTPTSVDEDGNPVAATGIFAEIEASTNSVLAKMAEYEANGLSRDTALNKAITAVADDLGVARDEIAAQIGAPASVDDDGNLIAATGVYATIDATTNSVLAKMAEYEAAGISRDAALDKAITAVADDLGIAKDELAAQIGAPASVDDSGNPVEATGVYAAISGVSADLQTKYDALTAGQKKIADDLVQQGIDLNTAIDTAKGELQQNITETQTQLSSEIQAVADAVGKPATEVTQADIDLVNQMIAGDVDTNLAYDANQDGVINQSDIDILTDVLAGTTPQWLAPEGSTWSPTGIYRAQADEAARLNAANMAAQTASRNAAAAAAQKTQRMGNINSMLGMLMQAPDLQGQQVTVKAPDPTKIGYVYDWNSIFANPSQSQMFVSPFGARQPLAQGLGFSGGGTVRAEDDDINDALTQILRG